jgi:gluconolactonase
MKWGLSGNAISFCTTLLFLSYCKAPCQSLGTVNLPSFLADQGAKIESAVLSKPQKITYCEGPVVDKDGNLFFSEQMAGIVWKVTPGGNISKFLTFNNQYANGMDFAPDGNLVICEKDRITERDANGNLVKVVTSGNTWGQGANDLTYSSKGDLFFTAFNQHFWFHSKDSSINRDYNFTSPSNICFNGIEYIEEKGIIYINEWGLNKVIVCKVSANGVVDTANKKTFCNINGPDGITIDSNYNVYIASNSGSTGSIYVYDSTGNQLGTISMRQDNDPSMNASNCVFGGPDNKTLYITGDSGAYKIQLKVAGRVRPGNVVTRNNLFTVKREHVSPPYRVLINGGNYSDVMISGTRESNAAVLYDIFGRFINSSNYHNRVASNFYIIRSTPLR